MWMNQTFFCFFENSRPSASNFKSFSRSQEFFFLTVGQNNFGNKIPFIKSNVTQLFDPGKKLCTRVYILEAIELFYNFLSAEKSYGFYWIIIWQGSSWINNWTETGKSPKKSVVQHSTTNFEPTNGNFPLLYVIQMSLRIT